MSQPFSLRTALILGLGFLGIIIVGPIFNTFVPIFLKEAGLSATFVGFVMTWDNYINLVVQPVAGERSDHTRTRFGRRKPWIIVGAPIAALGFVLIPLMPTLGGLMALILVTNLALSLFRSPAVSLLGDLFPQSQRSAANGVINLMGGVGAILGFLVGGMLYDHGRVYAFAFGSVVMMVMFLPVLLLVREPESPGEREEAGGVWGVLAEIARAPDRAAVRTLAAMLCMTVGYSALEAWLSSFGKFGLGIDEGRMSRLTSVMPLSFVACAVPSGLLATRFGRRRVILAGVVGLTALCVYGLTVRSEIMLLGLLLSVGLFWALININALPLVYDVGGEARIGALTGLYYLSGSLALITGPPVVGGLIDLTGNNYRVMFVVSGVFMALAGLLLHRMREVPAQREGQQSGGLLR